MLALWGCLLLNQLLVSLQNHKKIQEQDRVGPMSHQ